MMVSALIDRVTFRSHILDMNVSESYRFKRNKKKDFNKKIKTTDLRTEINQKLFLIEIQN